MSEKEDRIKIERIYIRVSKKFKERLKSLIANLKDQGKNINMTDFIYQAISEKMRKMNAYNNNNMMKQIKEMAKKLNSVDQSVKAQDITIKQSAKIMEKEDKFDTYQDIDKKINIIKGILEEHRQKESYIASTYTDNRMGCIVSEIIEKSELERLETWDTVKYLERTHQIKKCKNGGYDLNV